MMIVGTGLLTIEKLHYCSVEIEKNPEIMVKAGAEIELVWLLLKV